MNAVRKFINEVRLYAVALGKWLAVAALTGVLCGLIGSAFALSVGYVTRLRAANGWLLYLLPLAGVAVASVYRALRTEGMGTDDIIDAVHLGKPLSAKLVPSIFIGTVLTHLCGGSAGREGAALQMGGTIGYWSSRALRLDDRDTRTGTLCGMAAFFSALFGTPLAATMFAIMAISVGELYHAAFIPCFTASLVAYGLSMWLGVAPVRFTAVIPALASTGLVRAAILAALCAWVSALFCALLHASARHMKKFIPNPWLRAAAGGAIVVALTLICGTTDYNGAGMDVIAAAMQGHARPEAFALKMLFTVLTMTTGYKGGEIVPAMFIGATAGCVLGNLFGLAPGLGAAVGLLGMFCGSLNCPISAIFLGVEMFGGANIQYYAIAAAISFMLSANFGLYKEQKIVYSKIRAEFINRYTD